MPGEIHVKIPQFIRIKSIHSIIEATIGENEQPCGESHACWEFLQLKRGTFNVLVDGMLVHLEPGEMLCYAPYAFHIKATPLDCDVVVFSFLADASFLEQFANRKFYLTNKQQELLDELISRGKHIFNRYPPVITKELEIIQPEEGYPHLQMLANLMELFLIDLYQNNPLARMEEEPPKTKNLRQEQFELLTNYFKEHIYENLTLEQISNDVNIGIANLQKLCKIKCGCGPTSYFLLMKLNMAKQMIRGTPLNITQISQSLGFSSVHYFSKVFKSKIGMSPSTYAKSLAK